MLKKHREPAQETNKQNEHEFAFCPLFYIKGNLIFKAQFIMLASKFHHFVSFAYANLALKTIFFLAKARQIYQNNWAVFKTFMLFLNLLFYVVFVWK